MVLLSVALFAIAIGIPVGVHGMAVHGMAPHQAAARSKALALSAVVIGCGLVLAAHPLGATSWTASDLISAGAGLTVGGIVVANRRR